MDLGRNSLNKFHGLAFASLLIVVTFNICEINGVRNGVRINKCCETFEILLDGVCTNVNKTSTGTQYIGFTAV